MKEITQEKPKNILTFSYSSNYNVPVAGKIQRWGLTARITRRMIPPHCMAVFLYPYSIACLFWAVVRGAERLAGCLVAGLSTRITALFLCLTVQIKGKFNFLRKEEVP